jgi:hypothetical protein
MVDGPGIIFSEKILTIQALKHRITGLCAGGGENYGIEGMLKSRHKV